MLLANRNDGRPGARVELGRASLIALAACQPAASGALPIHYGKQGVERLIAQHKAVFRHYLSIWERGALDELPSVVASNYVGHAASGDRDIGGLRERISAFRKLYPNVRFTIEDQIAEGDRVATRMTATARSSATGKPVKLIGLNVSRFEGGSIAEEWPVWEAAR